MVRKFDQMTRDEATRLRKDGKSVREIALLTGVALTTLKGWFKEIGLSRLPEPATRRRYTISEQQGILAEYGARKSPKVIVEKYGISKSTLFYWKKKHRVLATSKSGQRYTASEVVGMKRALTMAKRIESILGECKCNISFGFYGVGTIYALHDSVVNVSAVGVSRVFASMYDRSVVNETHQSIASVKIYDRRNKKRGN